MGTAYTGDIDRAQVKYDYGPGHDLDDDTLSMFA
jgi:hypothetical protein